MPSLYLLYTYLKLLLNHAGCPHLTGFHKADAVEAVAPVERMDQQDGTRVGGREYRFAGGIEYRNLIELDAAQYAQSFAGRVRADGHEAAEVHSTGAAQGADVGDVARQHLVAGVKRRRAVELATQPG